MIRPRLPSPGARIRELMAKGTVVLPGAYDAITAKLAANAGAEAIYLSGAGVSNSRLAAPDVALLTLDEMAQQAKYVCDAVQVPVIADADTGYGETWNVMRCVREFERAGLAGIHIEDQVSPKRCGHLDGKELIPAEQMQQKIRAAANARTDDSFLIIARTDARGVNGLEEAVSRANAYVGAGADCIFPEGLESAEEFAKFRSGVGGEIKLLANMTEFGKTPIIPTREFEVLGYNLVIFPMTAFRVMLKAVGEAYETLLREGTQAALMDRMKTRKELYDLIEYPAYERLDRDLSQQG